MNRLRGVKGMKGGIKMRALPTYAETVVKTRLVGQLTGVTNTRRKPHPRFLGIKLSVYSTTATTKPAVKRSPLQVIKL